MKRVEKRAPLFYSVLIAGGCNNKKTEKCSWIPAVGMAASVQKITLHEAVQLMLDFQPQCEDSCNSWSIDLAWVHNHSTDNLEAYNFKDLCMEVIEKIKKLYEACHTPSTARQQYLEDLWHVKKADRSTMPQRRDFLYIYGQFGKETFGGKHDGMFC
ncbi:Hypothetical predicted protein [Paramuricea clavata]|uniref:Uncharacterized protein n=1 Tax=Paramuricea clavata TaxID=317549 RepID=A0A6S7HRK2_PARCT|nr:Hypothetical predicted protein [Paramuricea clavata]